MTPTAAQGSAREPLRFGLQLTAIHDSSVPVERQLAEHRELVSLGAELGFDTISAGQHFLGGHLRYLQPIPYLACLGQQAPGMRVATGILLLSLLNPLDVAEQFATLDAVTGGRAVLGLGLGYSDHEFEAFGVDRKTRVGRFKESLDVIKALWSGEPVEHHGRHFDIVGTSAVTPVQRPRPPIWIGGQSEPAVRRAAREADAWYVPPFPTHDALRRLAEVFAAEREAAGLEPAREFPVRRELVIAPTVEEARRAAVARSEGRYETYRSWGLNADMGDAGRTIDDRDQEAIDGRFLLGPPEVVAERLDELHRTLGMTHFMFKPQWPGLPHAEAIRQLELLGTEVMPLLGGRA